MPEVVTLASLKNDEARFGHRFLACERNQANLVTLNVASWNQLDGWLRQLEAFRVVA
jgi:hypothetical protein